MRIPSLSSYISTFLTEYMKHKIKICKTFSTVVAPSHWNSLPKHIPDCSDCSFLFNNSLGKMKGQPCKRKILGKTILVLLKLTVHPLSKFKSLLKTHLVLELHRPICNLSLLLLYCLFFYCFDFGSRIC